MDTSQLIRNASKSGKQEIQYPLQALQSFSDPSVSYSQHPLFLKYINMSNAPPGPYLDPTSFFKNDINISHALSFC